MTVWRVVSLGALVLVFEDDPVSFAVSIQWFSRGTHVFENLG